MLTYKSPEKTNLWNRPPSDLRYHLLLGDPVHSGTDLEQSLHNALSSELLGEQIIDDYYYDTENFELFTKGYACCLRLMLGKTALCLIPVTVNGEYDVSRSTLVDNQAYRNAPLELRVLGIESDEIATLLLTISTAKKLQQQFYVQTSRKHYRILESSALQPVILDQVKIKAVQSGSSQDFTTNYSELILTSNSADNSDIRLIRDKLKKHVASFPIKTNAYRRAIEMDAKLPKKVQDSKISQIPVDRSGHDLFRVHMLKQLAEIQRWETVAIEGRDVEGVHQMRVTIRRIRAALKTFAPLLLKSDTEHWHTEFRWLARSLGVVRDLDVFGEWLDEHKSAADSDVNEYIEAYQKDLDTLHHHARQGLLENLASDRYRTLILDFTAWVEQEQCYFVNNDLTWKPTQELADALIKRAVQRINKKIKLVDSKSSADQLHRFRVECKRVRYSMDMLQSYASKDQKPLITKLKQVQEILGEHQDACERSKRIQLYAKGQNAGGRGQEFVFFLGTLYAEQQPVIRSMAKAFFEQQGSLAKLIEKALKA